MRIYLATIAEVTACRLRILSRAIGWRTERAERDAASNELDCIMQGLAVTSVASPLIYEALSAAKHQKACLAQGELRQVDVDRWAVAWVEWSKKAA